ncbi:MAG: MJ0042-type zinc finger domain-containing protein [Gemmataceae bacterium]
MPIIVACPNCAGQLRVADGLIGRKVRCPACNATFDTEEPAAASPPPPPDPKPLPDLERPVPTERVDPWKSLNLELTPDPPASSPELPPAPPGPREPPPQEEEAPRRPRRPRLNDDHDDLRPCPNCGRMLHRDSRRCGGCGELVRGSRDDDPEGDVRRERRRRHDWEPHRAGFVLAMGLISLAGPFVCPPLVFLGMIPGLMAWAMGSADLRKMRRGEMDPEGHGNTQAGWICGILGTLMSTLVVLGCGGIISIAWLAEVQQGQGRPRPGVNPAPIVRPNR